MSIVIHRVPTLLACFVFLVLLADAATASRAEITALWRADEPAEATEPGDVCWLRDADLSEAATVAVGDALAAGDQLTAGPCASDQPSTGGSGDLLIGIRCGDGTDLQLAGDFDLLLLEPENEDCAADLRQGTADVLTDQPATITSGGITLGVEGTQFAITREPPSTADGESLFVCRLFEGRLRVQRPEKEIRLDGGELWTWDGRDVVRKPVRVADAVEASERAARLDTARAFARGTLSEAPQRSVETLTRRHVESLLKPDDAAARRDLADSLAERGLDERATFERRRVVEQDSPTRRDLNSGTESSGDRGDGGDRGDDGSGSQAACQQSALDAERATQRVHLPTELGIVILELPTRLTPGDVISGSMTFSASGRDNQERRRLRKLERFQVALGGLTLPVEEGAWTARLPRGSSTKVELQNQRGRTQAERALSMASGSARMSRSGFTPSCSCRAGYPLAIAGSFDGDLRTTRVSLDGRPARVLAESPRETLVECPGELTGSRSLVVEEAGQRQEVRGFRVVQLDVEIVPRQIERNKTATATVRLSGLAGQQQSYCLRVRNQDPKIVKMDGGNEQWISLSPNGWQVGDTRSLVFDLEGKKRGVASVGVELLPHGCPR